jgi:hypothetical protein
VIATPQRRNERRENAAAANGKNVAQMRDSTNLHCDGR